MSEAKELVKPFESPALADVTNDLHVLPVNATEQNLGALRGFLAELGKSDIVLGIVILMLADIALRFGFTWAQQGSPKLAFDIPYRSRTWYAAQDFLSEKKAPDVVLLGASDMACAVYGAEATFLNIGECSL